MFIEFLVLEDMFDVFADRALGLAEQICELFLVKPDGLVFEAHVQLRAAVFALADQDRVHGYRILTACRRSSPASACFVFLAVISYLFAAPLVTALDYNRE
jgi:hypothetical protein